MNFLRKTLFPFAILYGFITSIRNFLFDCGILKSHAFPIPVIAVGNLSVGGTGKTPQIEYLIRLLSNKYQIATLSRGYKRKSEGFILANPTSNAEILGDEPFQFYKKFPNIQVAVAANRKNGIERLLSLPNKPEIILLDDAFQHRKVKAGFYILLTAYNDLFVNDFMLPTGNLRESRSGAKRANMIIVTKCPKDISELAQNKIKEALINYNNKKAEVFFTFIDYDDKIYSANKALNVNEVKTASKLLLAGIAKPKSFFAHLQSQNDECLVYPDHHHFLEKNITDIKEKAKNKIIITTEKDFVRLSEKLNSDNLFYLPIKSLFVNNEKKFDKKIINYVESSTTNG
ncbi:tetraacyldisaccharide 4'-kinase [Flavobacterium psychrophilum]|uniref:tetraacyldisaccharide 4'-kinase n=1 Tax=Flavobacterium psychrophilum TaxID=96345 RepID=UPI000B7C3CB5|nr:tetraacyldisaccharide 4'-kinase [Flavobacterium psychrophilum]EKT2069792.1 tetraacyldisaccharide 4'-kinase [Flavobacterium psychrophilum]ELY1979283.1 tetraacyldisaccharide 4'-kinase [Flavobacterium psychrophilum]MCB6088557.1 tetraacyldisaccharide 4'-kinase [Flavobacterium psychrophilum]SNA66287.1 Tetraacyldisaccharide 4'-kinase [Flavobacterium psychrophilum]